MNQTSIINELKTIIAHSDEVKQKATGLLRKLEGVSTPSTSRKGVDPELAAKVLANRRKIATR
jgi:hypothetical protein